MTPIPTWRSLLFVPADKPRVLEKAHERGADALVVDLEDAVPRPAKPAARAALAGWIATLSGHGAQVVVRVNSGWLDLIADLDAAVRPGLAAIMLPQVRDDMQLRAVSGILDELEAARGMPSGGIGLLALIESPAALSRLAAVAGLPRVVGLALGSEDYALTLRAEPAPPALIPPCHAIAQQAAERGLMAIGLTDSLTNFHDLDRHAAACAQAHALGMTGALCIHPAQVDAVNRAFAPSPAQRQWAARVLEAWDAAQAQGLGVCAIDGAMIDRPVVERAHAILSQG